jgi:hypothetical protein
VTSPINNHRIIASFKILSIASISPIYTLYQISNTVHGWSA